MGSYFPRTNQSQRSLLKYARGKGKGNPEGFVAPVTPGRLIFEIEGVPFDIAKGSFALGCTKFPVTTKFVVRRDYDMANQNA